MTAAVIATTTQSMRNTINTDLSSVGTVARKRRRQILQSQRTKVNEESSPPPKKLCVEPSTCSITESVPTTDTHDAHKVTSPNSFSKTKKPQMRYDPEVPMTKDEAAAWRREQRRKRNRESAAASRQRQRDRISELEEEVSEWKSKYEAALARIQELEQLKESSQDEAMTNTDAPPLPQAVSPCASPRPYESSASSISDTSCDEMSLPCEESCNRPVKLEACQEMQEENVHMKHLSEKISRPAVKITGAKHEHFPLTNLESNEIIPEPCTSLSLSELPSLDEILPIPVSPVLKDLDSPDEVEFDQFLLDAAEWL
mmetsp:Transcript_14394/g.16344  ORF Transcript_14394/g.16344 Transcript_14394/m.16344 type:complete len:314 (-) Transcript_14394:195-1136(-)